MIVGDTTEAIATPNTAEDHEAVVLRTGGRTKITMLGTGTMITVIATTKIITAEVGYVGSYDVACCVPKCRNVACLRILR